MYLPFPPRFCRFVGTLIQICYYAYKQSQLWLTYPWLVWSVFSQKCRRLGLSVSSTGHLKSLSPAVPYSFASNSEVKQRAYVRALLVKTDSDDPVFTAMRYSTRNCEVLGLLPSLSSISILLSKSVCNTASGFSNGVYHELIAFGPEQIETMWGSIGKFLLISLSRIDVLTRNSTARLSTPPK